MVFSFPSYQILFPGFFFESLEIALDAELLINERHFHFWARYGLKRMSLKKRRCLSVFLYLLECGPTGSLKAKIVSLDIYSLGF